MSAEELEHYESQLELDLYREYRDIVHVFKYMVHTERRLYLANIVDVQIKANDAGDVYFDVVLSDAWVWDLYGQARFVANARVLSFKDVNVEELIKPDIDDVNAIVDMPDRHA
ncbi:MAG: DUF2469 family protein [Actinobacteria bacterium]|uniref:Unannotated protein n=1 Tax=freshwater metagenome TaxID=449393 RepID=A0A6J5ZP27_9ZZZZ|nr:DUF2469 family protein [Actinomycetota bacterium]